MEGVVGQVIIAMKGHPGTGKSTLGRALAGALKWPLIDKDDVRDCTAPLDQQYSLPVSVLNDLSYQVIWSIARTQLLLGLSLVLDSPLSRRAHLDRLLQLASSSSGGARVFVVECIPQDQLQWRRRLQRRAASDTASWHKPATWQELETLVEGYGGSSDYDVGGVPKLVVNTTAAVGIEELVSEILQFIVSHAGDRTESTDFE
ncbi:hypothetical protein HHK36_000696 [Tetracentron sinense]|uniref:P-loop containing nucleoside triphosphate hydrolase protein n=1 Tax=Tetracentron sinense TaxID=13715 RepID=A0A835DU92_TETSI|nr:hypothetical protein HHK36_000696 [Tetracentron sinense]